MTALTATIDKEEVKQESFTRNEVFLLVVLSLMQFTFIVDYILMMPLGAEIMASFDISPKKFSYLISVYTCSAATSGFFVSFFIDRFERKKALIISYLGFSVGPILSTLSYDFDSLLIARVFSGAFGGVLTALVITMIGDALSNVKIGRGTSFVLSANAVASVLGVPAALFLVHFGSWKTPFFVLFPLNVCVLLAAIFILPSMKKHLHAGGTRSMPTKKLLAFINNPNFIWPLAFMSLLTLAGGFTILPFLSAYLTHNQSFSAPDISVLFFLGGLASFLTAPLAGTLSDRFGKQNVFLWLNFMSIIPIMILTVFPLGSKAMVLSVTTLFFMFSTGRHVSGMALINSKFDEKIRGRFITLNSSIQLFTGSLGTILAGYLIFEENNLIYNFDLIGIIAIAATIICIFTAFILDE